MPDFTNPQGLNRYSYCLNNPLVYVDPSGHAEVNWGELGNGVVTLVGSVIGMVAGGTAMSSGPFGMVGGYLLIKVSFFGFANGIATIVHSFSGDDSPLDYSISNNVINEWERSGVVTPEQARGLRAGKACASLIVGLFLSRQTGNTLIDDIAILIQLAQHSKDIETFLDEMFGKNWAERALDELAEQFQEKMDDDSLPIDPENDTPNDEDSDIPKEDGVTLPSDDDIP